MLKRRSKHFALLLVLTMLATMFVGVGTASAKSVNSVDVVKSIASDYTGTASYLTIKEDSGFPADFASGQTFRLTLPNGVKWNSNTYPIGAAAITMTNNDGAASDATIIVRTTQVMEVIFNGCAGTASVDVLRIPLDITVDGGSGELKVALDGMDSAVTSGSITFANVLGGKNTTATVDEVLNIGQTGSGGTIRIDEAAIMGVASTDGTLTVKLKLPSKFKWDAAMANTMIVPGAGWAAASGPTAASVTGQNTNELTFTIGAFGTRAQRGALYISPKIKADSDASYGDVTVSISSTVDKGKAIDDAELIVAKYINWGVNVKVEEVKELISGKFDDQKTAKITIEENVGGTLIQNRDLKVTFPSGVKVTNISNWSTTNVAATQPAVGANSAIDGTKGDFDIRITTPTTTTKGKIEFTVDLSIEANKSGDIEATFKGAGAEESKLVVAKTVVPASLAMAEGGKVVDVKLGASKQAIGDLIITEAKKAALEKLVETTNASPQGVIQLALPTGVSWDKAPTVEVIEGDLTIKTAETKILAGTNDQTVGIYVDSESFKPSKLKISNILLNINRTVPEGEIWVKLNGTAVTENYEAYAAGWRAGASLGAAVTTTLDSGEFGTATVSKLTVANLVTPASSDIGNVSSFIIGTASFKLNGVETTMDVAPYIKDSRTYMPLRYVANALGVSDSNIVWDGVNSSVTLMKGDKVVQVKIGSKSMSINGAVVTMEVAPEIANSRTMLPISFIANAFGYTAEWDGATQTVTIK